MKEFQDSLPQGREFLFCGILGVPTVIKAWEDEIEVHPQVVGYGDIIDSLIGLRYVDGYVKVSPEMIDTRTILDGKLRALEEKGLGLKVSFLQEVGASEDMLDFVTNELARFECALSYAYTKDGKVIMVTKAGAPLVSSDGVVALRSTVMKAFKKGGETVSMLPLYKGCHVGFGVRLIVTGDRERRRKFLAGLLLHAPECTVFTNATHLSYLRLNTTNCPHYVSYGRINGVLCRVLDGESETDIRITHPDSSGNVYLLLSALVEAGLMGVNYETILPDEVSELTPTVISGLVRLPMSLKEALNLAEGSGFLRRVLGDAFSNIYYTKVLKETKVFDTVASDEEYARYYSDLIKKC